MANVLGPHGTCLLLVALASACGGAAQSADSPNPPVSVDTPESSAKPTVRANADPVLLGRLQDASQVEAAVVDLIGQFGAAAANGTGTTEARAFVASYAGPLSDAFVDQYAAISPKTRGSLLNLLLSFDDPRAIPAHQKAIQNYAATGTSPNDAIAACQAAQRMKDDRLANALLTAFQKLDMSDKDGRRFSRHLQAAMLFNASSNWAPVLLTHLAAPIHRPASFSDKAAVKSFQNELFWQTSAAMLLGEMREASAVTPLMAALLDKTKRDVHPHAELALLKLGKPSVGVAEQLLTAADANLVALAKAAEPELAEPQVFFAADLLAKLAPASSRGKLEQAWTKTKDPVSKVLLALALARLPKQASSLEIWKKTTLATQLHTTLPRGESALEALAESAPYWFEPELVPWLNQRVSQAPGKGSRKGDLQRGLVIAISHLLTEPYQKAAHKVAQEFGGRTGTPAFDAASKQLALCGEDPACYAKELNAGASSSPEVLLAIKAAVMVGIFGKNEHRDALLGKLGDVRNRTLQEAIVRAIEHLSPQPDAKLLDALAKLSAPPQGQPETVQADTVNPISLGLFRLRMR